MVIALEIKNYESRGFEFESRRPHYFSGLSWMGNTGVDPCSQSASYGDYTDFQMPNSTFNTSNLIVQARTGKIAHFLATWIALIGSGIIISE